MIRYLTAVPIIVLAGVPFCTAPSWPVLLLGAIAGLFCAAGAFSPWPALVTLGSSLSVIDYAFALVLSAAAVDIVGAAAFGLALVFLLDLTEFVRRFRGAELGAGVWRTQISFWLGRAAVSIAAVVLLTLGAAIFSTAIQSLGRPIVAGFGAAIAFAAALHKGIVRGPDNQA
jgi:hypothetical protein